MTLSSRRRTPERSISQLNIPHSDSDVSPPFRKRRLVARGVSTNNVLSSSVFLLFCWCLYSYQHIMPSCITPRVSEFRRHPLEIEYDYVRNQAFKTRKLSYRMSKPAAKGYPINCTYPDPPYQDVCRPMHDWQMSMFSSCNNLHEVDMMPTSDGAFLFIHCGSSRCAFKVMASDGTPVALKLGKFRNSHNYIDYHRAWKDGLALERLQASPYILDIYGYCGLSQLMEYGNGGNIHDLVKIARLKGRDDMRPVDRLKIGIQIASAVSDVHTFEKDGVPSIVHNDIDCHQFVRVNGVYKLNDFHLGHFQEKNNVTGKVCMGETDFGRRYALAHSPEENMHSHVWHEKSDDYMAGNVMYNVLTKQWVFEEKSSYKEALKRLVNGERSPFPHGIRNSRDRADQALMKGIQMLWTHNVNERPTTRQVADFLMEELKAIEGTDEEIGVVRVENLPPLPKNHRYTDEDYENNLRGWMDADLQLDSSN